MRKPVGMHTFFRKVRHRLLCSPRHPVFTQNHLLNPRACSAFLWFEDAAHNLDPEVQALLSSFRQQALRRGAAPASPKASCCRCGEHLPHPNSISALDFTLSSASSSTSSRQTGRSRGRSDPPTPTPAGPFGQRREPARGAHQALRYTRGAERSAEDQGDAAVPTRCVRLVHVDGPPTALTACYYPSECCSCTTHHVRAQFVLFHA